MNLSEIRKEIDAIDDQLVKLFCDRMQLSAQVADYKRANNMPIYVPEREQAILDLRSEQAGPELAAYVQALYSQIFELSRNYQHKRNADKQ